MPTLHALFEPCHALRLTHYVKVNRFSNVKVNTLVFCLAFEDSRQRRGSRLGVRQAPGNAGDILKHRILWALVGNLNRLVNHHAVAIFLRQQLGKYPFSSVYLDSDKVSVRRIGIVRQRNNFLRPMRKQAFAGARVALSKIRMLFEPPKDHSLIERSVFILAYL